MVPRRRRGVVAGWVLLHLIEEIGRHAGHATSCGRSIERGDDVRAVGRRRGLARNGLAAAVDATRRVGAVVMARDGYPAGVPCWIDLEPPDVDAAISFYGGVFGWTFEDRRPPGPGSGSACDGSVVAALDGLTVAGISARIGETRSRSRRPAEVGHAGYVAVDDLDGGRGHGLAVGRTRAPADRCGPGRSYGAHHRPGGRCIAPLAGRHHPWCAGRRTPTAPGTGATWPSASRRRWATTAPCSGGSWYRGRRRRRRGPHGLPARLRRAPRRAGSGRSGNAGRQAPPVADPLAWVERSPAGTPASWRIVFAVADTDATVRRALELGGEVRVEPYDAGPVRTAVLADDRAPCSRSTTSTLRCSEPAATRCGLFG